jgi:hypothetical protein
MAFPVWMVHMSFAILWTVNNNVNAFWNLKVMWVAKAACLPALYQALYLNWASKWLQRWNVHMITMICESKDELNVLQTDKKTSHYTSCLFSCLHVSNRQQSSTLLYLPWVGELRRCTILSKIHLVFFVCLCTSFKYFFLKGLWPARSWQRLY